MPVIRCTCASKAVQPIGKHLATQHEAGLGITDHLGSPEKTYTVQMHQHSPTVPHRLLGDDEGYLTVGSLVTLTRLISALADIAHLDTPTPEADGTDAPASFASACA